MDDLKHPSEFQEPLQQIGSFQTWVSNLEGNKPIKNCQSRIKFKTRNCINGCCREEKPHFQEKDQNPELKGYHRKLKNHFPSSLMAENQKQGENAGYESDVHGGHVKINIEKTTCLVCGKIFPSMKSLYGHMRLHPERQYRGIKPPLTSKPKNISTFTVSTMGKINDQNSPSTSGRSDFDLLQFLKGWSVTGKRGRLSLDEREASEGLSMLVNGNALDLAKRNTIDRTRVTEDTLMAEIQNTEQVLESPDLQKKRKMEGLETGNTEFQCKKLKIDKEIEKSRDGLNPGFVKMASGLEILDGFQEFLGENREVDQLGNTYTLFSIPRNYISYKSEIMKKFCELGMMNYNETPIISDRFDCSICNKSFPSYQALGGHKSASHMNFKNNNHKAYVEEVSLVDITVGNLTQVDDSWEFNSSMLKKNVGTHPCKICDKTFPTGQALGGHQRQHRYGLPRANISSVAILEEAITMDHKLVEIDLNGRPCGMVNVSS